MRAVTGGILDVARMEGLIEGWRGAAPDSPDGGGVQLSGAAVEPRTSTECESAIPDRRGPAAKTCGDGCARERKKRRNSERYARAGGKRTLPLVLIAVASLLPRPVASQEYVSDRSRFVLYTGCAVNLTVVMAGGGETEAETETAVRSRLRAARIYDPEAPDRLFVFGGRLYGDRFGDWDFKLEFWKNGFQDPRTGTSGSLNTWIREGSGRFEALRGLLDVFVDEYLRVNECRQ